MKSDPSSHPLPKPGKGQFRCFQCRQLFRSKDGNWYMWTSMEVHLCNGCEKTTRDQPERQNK